MDQYALTDGSETGLSEGVGARQLRRLPGRPPIRRAGYPEENPGIGGFLSSGALA
jgi:hypothetical protein